MSAQARARAQTRDVRKSEEIKRLGASIELAKSTCLQHSSNSHVNLVLVRPKLEGQSCAILQQEWGIPGEKPQGVKASRHPIKISWKSSGRAERWRRQGHIQLQTNAQTCPRTYYHRLSFRFILVPTRLASRQASLSARSLDRLRQSQRRLSPLLA